MFEAETRTPLNLEKVAVLLTEWGLEDISGLAYMAGRGWQVELKREDDEQIVVISEALARVNPHFSRDVNFIHHDESGALSVQIYLRPRSSDAFALTTEDLETVIDEPASVSLVSGNVEIIAKTEVAAGNKYEGYRFGDRIILERTSRIEAN